MYRILLLFMLVPALGFAQGAKPLILKVRPLTWGVALNPNLEVEKVVTAKLSVSADAVWRRHSFESSGGEGFNRKFFPSSGFAAGIHAKYYYSNNRKAPFGPYFGGRLSYYSFKINNINQYDDGDYIYTININSKGPEMALFLGRQFKTGRFCTDIHLGAELYLRTYKETLVSAVRPSYYPHHPAVPYVSRVGEAYPFIRWSIGYNLIKSTD